MSLFQRNEQRGGVSTLPALSLLPFVAIALTACRWNDALLMAHSSGETAGVGGTAGSPAGGEVAGGGGSGGVGVCSKRAGNGGAAGLTDGLVAWYRCESATGTSEDALSDSTTNRNDAALQTASGGAKGYSFAAGRVGNALDLILAQNGYVTLPVGLLAGACDVTIATFVYINSNVNAWTRIWDFGQDTSAYMFLTPITNTDNVARFGISVDGNTHEEVITSESAVPTLRWTHVAVVLGPAGGLLYFDGAPVGANPTMTLRPADLGSTVNNYIGRSQFSDDPYLDGDIDEFRIYERALSPSEIQALANGS